MKLGYIYTSVAAALITLASCGSGNDADKPYVPTKEFLPAYNALLEANTNKGYSYQKNESGEIVKVETPTNGNNNEFYDIEETVRILNGLEIAQMQTHDFYSFLEYMAKQDYSMVPDEIISAKMKLLPILQEMYILEQENKELDDLTNVFNSLGTGLYSFAKDQNANEFVSGITGVITAFENPISGIVNAVTGKTSKEGLNKMIQGESIQAAKTAAFDYYEQQNKLKGENSKRIAELKAQYLVYLENFTPIYTKYIQEWERLTLEKDKAYLAVWTGRSAEGYSLTHSILEKYPGNREMMLLKSLACINLAKGENAPAKKDTPALTVGNENSTTAAQKYKYALEAQNILNNYINLYPDKSAPALVLLGEVEMLNGNESKAMTYFDQSAMEYPKQAQELKDMLNSYALRSYLNNTPEGKYLMRLYRSTMEGYGWFSPNFHKALYWDSKGDTGKASTEIYNHFFRRGNQGLYDCLLTDMEFCENNLHRSFKSQFMESSVLNVTVEEETHMFSDNGIKFSLTNNSDLNLENVRLYICLHLKGMYTDEYEVVPCNAINFLAPNGVQSWSIDGYNINDIVRARGIMMTDDRVCWVDDITYKQSNAKKNYYGLNGLLSKSLDIYSDYNLSEDKIVQNIKSEIKGTVVTPEVGILQKMTGSKGENLLTIELPRVLCLIDPVFSIGELSKNCTPSSQVLQGSVIKLEFKMNIDQPYEPLYLYSDFINLRLEYEVDGDKVKITNIKKI